MSRPLPSLLAVVVVLSTVGGAATVASAQSSGDVIGRPDVEVFAAASEFEPGTESELALTLSNSGYLTSGGPAQYEERVTTARGLTVEVHDEGVPFEVRGGPFAVGSVPRGLTPVDPFEVTVPEDAEPGTYRLPVTLSYRFTGAVSYGVGDPEYNDYSRERREYVTLRVRPQAQFRVVDSRTTAQVGDTGEFAVTVENVGTETAREASVALASPSDELTFGSGSAASTGFVESWDPGERHTLEYTVAMGDDAPLRNYTVRATVDYEDADGIARTSSPSAVGLRPAAEQTFALSGVNSTLRVGEEGDFTGTVVNEGPTAARNAVVVFESGNPNVDVETGEYAVGTLEAGERADFDFDVTVTEGASASAQQFNVTVRYRNQRGDLRVSDGLEQRVLVEPQRDRFVVEAVNDTVFVGESGELRVRVTNNGDELLRDVEAKAFVQDPLSSDDDEAIVSELAPGESATVVIGLSVGGDALTKTYPVSFDFQYERPDGDTAVSQTYKVPVQARQPAQRGSGLPVWAFVLAALVLVGGVAVWRRQRG